MNKESREALKRANIILNSIGDYQSEQDKAKISLAMALIYWAQVNEGGTASSARPFGQAVSR